MGITPCPKVRQIKPSAKGIETRGIIDEKQSLVKSEVEGLLKKKRGSLVTNYAHKFITYTTTQFLGTRKGRKDWLVF